MVPARQLEVAVARRHYLEHLLQKVEEASSHLMGVEGVQGENQQELQIEVRVCTSVELQEGSELPPCRPSFRPTLP